jgi:aerotolerance regulator-like protein/VWA domain-containing protein
MFGISFLSPLFLAGAAAVAVPIAIHLFYRRTEPVIEFAAMRYLRQAPVEESRRRRLRELLLLALRAAALLLLAFAFARPYITGAAAALTDEATIVLVDTSASLTAPGEFDRVRERAAAVIRATPATHAVGVLAFAHEADVVAPLSRDRAGALAAVGQLKPGAGATRFRAALRRAAEELGGRSGRIVVVTDLQQSGWDAQEAAIPEAVAVEIEEVDGPTANLAVTSLRLEGADVVAMVQNFSLTPVTDQVVFTLDARRVGAVPITLQPGANAEARLPLPGVDSGAVSAAISDRDGYAADNIRYVVLDPASAVSVLALTTSGHPSESLYVEQALTVVGGARGFRFRSVSGSGFASLDSGTVGQTDVIVVLGTRGLEQRGRDRLVQFVRAGGGLLLTAAPQVEPAVVKQALGDLLGTSWLARDAATLSFAPDDTRHPVFRVFGGVGALGNAGFRRAALLQSPGSARVLARFTDGTAALVEEKTGAGRLLVFASDLNHDGNDFPLQPTFLPFLHESLRYLASPRTPRSDYVVGELPGTPGLTPGVMQIGSPARRVAVNVDAREADPRRMTADAFRSGISRLQAAGAQRARAEARQQEDEQSLWRYGLLLMLVSLAAEGVLGRRLG